MDHDPLRAIDQAAQEELAQVKPPAAHRDDLLSPMKGVTQARQAVDDLSGKATRLLRDLQAGRVSPDQVKRQWDLAEAEVEKTIDTATGAGRKVLGALPGYLTDKVFPETPPRGGDVADIRTEVAARLDGIGSDVSQVASEFVDLTIGAIERGDERQMRWLMSSAGRDELRRRLGRDKADRIWPDVRTQVIARAKDAAKGDDLRAPFDALDQLVQVNKAYDAGAIAVHSRLEQLKREMANATMQMR